MFDRNKRGGEQRELGSSKDFEVGEDGSISYFTDDVPDDVREAAEAERDRIVQDAREKAAAEGETREAGTDVPSPDATPEASE